MQKNDNCHDKIGRKNGAHTLTKAAFPSKKPKHKQKEREHKAPVHRLCNNYTLRARDKMRYKTGTMSTAPMISTAPLRVSRVRNIVSNISKKLW